MQESQIQTSTTRSPIEIVEEFLAAGSAKDLARCAALMADDIVYQNVPFPPDRGRPAVERRLAMFQSWPVDIDVRVNHVAERGGVVLTERTDSLRGDWLDVSFWVCGTFEVRDGKITLWRDYFDLGSVALSFLTGPLRALLRARTKPSAT
jgi:limonene-1,2-epoxide hydrolase